MEFVVTPDLMCFYLYLYMHPIVSFSL